MSPPPANPPDCSTARFALIVWVGLVLVVLCARTPFYFSPLHEHGDAALNAIQIDHAKRFEEIHGNYSRFRFHHPGPAFFYAYAVAEIVLCDWVPTGLSPGNAHKLAGLALQAAFFALGLALLREQIRTRLLFPFVLLAAAIHFSIVDYSLWSIWPPHVLLMPFFAFGVACLSLAGGRIERLPWVVLAGSFLVHGHVAQPLFVGVLASAAYIATWRGAGRPWERNRPAHLAAGIILAAALLPLILDALRGPDSNIAEILRHLRESPDQPKKLLKVALYIASYFGYVRDQDVLLRELSWSSTSMFTTHAMAFAGWATLLAASGFVWTRLNSSTDVDRAFWRRFGVGLLLVVILCAYWARSQTGAMFEFNMYFFHAVSFAALLPLTAWTAGRLERLAPPRAASVALLIAAAAVAWFGFHRGALNDHEAGLARLAATREALARSDAARPKFIAFDEATWDSAAPIALALQRAGVPYVIDPRWDFMLPRAAASAAELADAPLRHDVWRVLRERGEAGELSLGNGHALVTTPAELTPPASLSFTSEGNGRRYLVAGISHLDAHGAFSWLAGPDAVLQFVPGAKHADVEFRLAFAPWGEGGAPLEVHFNGRQIWAGPADRPGEVRVRIPAAQWSELPVATLRLRLQGARSPHEIGRPLEWAGPSVSFRALEFVPVSP